MHTGNAKPQSTSPVICADADGNGIRDNGKLKVHPIVPIETQSNDAVKVIMLAMALEHTRACGVFYGLWETPESLVELNENCFRMVKLHRNESVEPSQEGTNNGNSDNINDPKTNKQRKDETLKVDASKCSSLQPMLFDLKKSSSRLAILKLMEAKDGKVIGKCNTELALLAAGNGTKNGFIASSERLLVQMPPFEKAHTFFWGSSANNISRSSKRGVDEESASSNIFTGAADATREIALNFRAKIDAGNEEKVDIFKRDSKTGSYLEVQRRFKSTAKEPVEQIEDVETKATEEEIVQGNINAHKKKNCLKDNRNHDLLPWKVLRCFPIEEAIVQKIEMENEILNELTRKQDELVAIEKSLEPQARGLLAMAIEARMEYELPESKQLLKDKEKTLTEFEEYLLKRKEIEQVRQERREEDMDAVCSICNDGEVTPDNQILFCEACNVAVHQICYGVERIPEGDYYCIACRHYERDKMIQSMSETSRLTARANLPPLPIVCELCPSKKGAFTRLDTSKSACDSCDSNTAKWVHMTCAKWHGLDFVKKGDASLVEDITELKQFYRRRDISCSICKGMRGAYTQCRHKGCTNYCHITCAIESGICEVVHGEDVEGNLIDSNPWSILCPNHSKIDKQQTNLKGIEELVKTAKEFPVEPMPPPLLTELGPYNHLTGEQRKMALSVREYEDRYIADILKTKLSGVRCEVCDVIEDIHGRNLSRCEVCGSVVCHTCQLFCENPCQRSFKCHGCSSLSKNEDASEPQCSEPQCSMCNQKGGLLVKATSAPMLKQGYWNNHPKEFERSLFKKAQWAHILCAFWLKKVTIDYETNTVDLSNVIAANGRHFVLNGYRCGLCGLKNGYKTKCATGRCHAHGEKNKAYHFHATCARQIGFEVAHYNEHDFVVRCYCHGRNENNLRARLEDLIETEKKRVGKDFSRSNAPMKFSDGSKLLHGAIMVMRMLGWAWRWAEWWVQYGSTWEPLLEPGQDESKMTARELRIIESSKESRMDDARRCRLAAFGAALRNRSYDTEKGFNTEAFERALRAVLFTRSLVGPLEEFEVDFFTDLLGRAYRSKSRLLGFGKDKIPVANEAFCLHLDDKSPKFELGERPLPGNRVPPHGRVFEERVLEPDDYSKYKNDENGNEVDVSLFTEIDYKYKRTLKCDVSGESSDEEANALNADIDTNLFDKDNSYILKQRRGRIPKVMRLSISVKIEGDELCSGQKKSKRRSLQSSPNIDSDQGDENFRSRKKQKSREGRDDAKSTLYLSKAAADASLNFDKKGYRPLQSNKQAFLLYAGIKSVDKFMKTPAIDMYKGYTLWRQQEGLPRLMPYSAAGNTLNKWKSDVRKFYVKLSENDEMLSEEPETSLDSGKETFSTKNKTVGRSDSAGGLQSLAPESRKKRISDGGIKSARSKKRSRIELENNSTGIESKQQLSKETDDDRQLEVRARKNRLRLSVEKEKSVPFVEVSQDVVETVDTPSRPRRSNLYRKGLFKEVDDDPNETDSEIEIVETRKRTSGRPRKSQMTAQTYAEVDGNLNTTDSEKDQPKQKKKKRGRGRPGTKKSTDANRPRKNKSTDPNRPRKNKSTDPNRPQKNKSTDPNRPQKNPNTDLLHVVGAEGIEFLKTIGITSDRVFLSSLTSEVSATYPAFREKGGQSVLKGTGAASKISSWKRIVRNAALAVDDKELAKAGFFAGHSYSTGLVLEKKIVDTKVNDEDDRCFICEDGGDLLICDGCEKSYHLQCVGLSEVPQGDWFCPECSLKDDDRCVVCDDGGELIVCDGCESAYHTSCAGLSGVPEGDWFCPKCNEKDDDRCVICNDGGVLILCDGCEKSYHLQCVGMSEVPEDDWFCAKCTK